MSGKNSSENGETEENTVPDGGWGWMVALGCYVMVVSILDCVTYLKHRYLSFCTPTTHCYDFFDKKYL